MSRSRTKYATIAEPAGRRDGLMLAPADPGYPPHRPRDDERDPCVSEAAHYAALLRDVALRLRTLAERGDPAELVALAELFDETALALEAKEHASAKPRSS